MPAWPLVITALAQMYFGTAFAFVWDITDVPESLTEAVLVLVSVLIGLSFLALAVRSCVRLWRLAPSGATWSLVATVVPVVAFCGLWATGPLSIGAWNWSSLVPGAFAVFLVVVLVRRLLIRDSDPAPSVTSEQTAH